MNGTNSADKTSASCGKYTDRKDALLDPEACHKT
jgi:hypothetical protein